MEIQWSLECVDRPILRSYNLSYCPITSPKNLTCKDGTEMATSLSNEVKQYKITGLKPYTTYRTILTMISDTRIGPPSDPRINTTYEATPSKPLNLMATEVKNTSVLLRWNAPDNLNGVLKNYEVWYNQHRRDVYEDTLGKTNFTFRLENLDSFTTYQIVVRACSNCCNCSGNSNSVTIRTDIGTPGMLDTQQVNDGPRKRVLFTWVPPVMKAGNVDYYEVNIHNTGDNKTSLARTRDTRCFLNVDTPIDATGLQAEQQWEVRIRPVNVIWSAHADFPAAASGDGLEERILKLDDGTNDDGTSARFQRHSSTGSNPPQSQSLEYLDRESIRKAEAQKADVHSPPWSQVTTMSSLRHHYDDWQSCTEEDKEVLKMLSLDKFRQELPGPWSKAYTHVTSTASMVWQPVVAIMVIIIMLVVTSFYVYKNFFRLKKGSVVLPPGLTDIAGKPPSDTKNGGMGGIGGGGLLGHGNDMVIVPEVGTERSHVGASIDAMYGSKACNSGCGGENVNGAVGSCPFEDRLTANVVSETGGRASVETSSLHEQEQSLLEDRLDAQSSASSSSIMMMMEHEDGAMLDNVGDEEEEDEEEEEEKQQHNSRHGLPASLQHDVRSAMVMGKPQLPSMHQTIIKPASNGYVTIAQVRGNTERDTTCFLS